MLRRWNAATSATVSLRYRLHLRLAPRLRLRGCPDASRGRPLRRAVRNLARRLLRQARLPAELRRDLRDLLGRVVGGKDRRLRREVVRERILRGLVEDDQI